jgi:hypothetical protein
MTSPVSRSEPAYTPALYERKVAVDQGGKCKEVPPADPKETGQVSGNPSNGWSFRGGEGPNEGGRRATAGDSGQGGGPSREGSDGDAYGDGGDPEAEFAIAPDAVVIAFSSRAAITKEPLVSVVNSEGYSIVSKSELIGHFLPACWTGTVILKPGESGEPVRLLPTLDPDGGDFVWSLGAGEYVMEAHAKQGRVGTVKGRGSGGIACARSGLQGPARPAQSRVHLAATSFGSIARAARAALSKPANLRTRPRASKGLGSKTEGEKGERAVAEEEEVESASRQMQDKELDRKMRERDPGRRKEKKTSGQLECLEKEGRVKRRVKRRAKRQVEWGKRERATIGQEEYLAKKERGEKGKGWMRQRYGRPGKNIARKRGSHSRVC